MKKTTWIIQNNMGAASDIQSYIESVKATGNEVIEIQHIPFSEDLPVVHVEKPFEIQHIPFSEDLPVVHVEKPFVVYGSISFIQACLKNDVLKHGVFGDLEVFTYQNWTQHYGDMLLNSSDNTIMTTVGDFSLSNISYLSEDHMVFVRSQHDNKSIPGRVVDVNEFFDWCQEAKKGLFAGVEQDTPIVVGKPYKIRAEWRLFVVNSEIITASQYHKNGKFFKQEGAPQEVIDFGKKVIDKWNPLPAYIIDVCMSANNLYIMEVQGFNSAGAYCCDISKVAQSIHDYFFQQQNKKKP